MSLSGPARQAQARDVAERLASFDRLVREHARASGEPQAILFDLNRGTVRRGEIQGDDGGVREQGSILQLPARFRIERLLLPSGPMVSGEARVLISARGQAPSYAVLLNGPPKARWLVVAGLTGQVTEAADATEAEQIFAALGGPARDDAR